MRVPGGRRVRVAGLVLLAPLAFAGPPNALLDEPASEVGIDQPPPRGCRRQCLAGGQIAQVLWS